MEDKILEKYTEIMTKIGALDIDAKTRLELLEMVLDYSKTYNKYCLDNAISILPKGFKRTFR